MNRTPFGRTRKSDGGKQIPKIREACPMCRDGFAYPKKASEHILTYAHMGNVIHSAWRRAATTSDAFNAVAEPAAAGDTSIYLAVEERPVGDIVIALRLDSSRPVSKHLRVLRDVGLYDAPRRSQEAVSDQRACDSPLARNGRASSRGSGGIS